VTKTSGGRSLASKKVIVTVRVSVGESSTHALWGEAITLCANMDETLPPSEFRVEGGEG